MKETIFLNLRYETKEILRKKAKENHVSMTNYIEGLILGHTTNVTCKDCHHIKMQFHVFEVLQETVNKINSLFLIVNKETQGRKS
jgi:hypothetical protein